MLTIKLCAKPGSFIEKRFLPALASMLYDTSTILCALQ